MAIFIIYELLKKLYFFINIFNFIKRQLYISYSKKFWALNKKEIIDNDAKINKNEDNKIKIEDNNNNKINNKNKQKENNNNNNPNNFNFLNYDINNNDNEEISYNDILNDKKSKWDDDW